MACTVLESHAYSTKCHPAVPCTVLGHKPLVHTLETVPETFRHGAVKESFAFSSRLSQHRGSLCYWPKEEGGKEKERS